MTLSSNRHDAVVSAVTVTVQYTAEETPRTWTLSFDGAEVNRVTTEADCVLTGTLPAGKGDIRAVVHQHMDGTVRIDLVHNGEPLVVFNDAQEVE